MRLLCLRLACWRLVGLQLLRDSLCQCGCTLCELPGRLLSCQLLLQHLHLLPCLHQLRQLLLPCLHQLRQLLLPCLHLLLPLPRQIQLIELIELIVRVTRESRCLHERCNGHRALRHRHGERGGGAGHLLRVRGRASDSGLR
jgi:hypothetical protein